jgi:mitochondrial chaperone BCS1
LIVVGSFNISFTLRECCMYGRILDLVLEDKESPGVMRKKAEPDKEEEKNSDDKATNKKDDTASSKKKDEEAETTASLIATQAAKAVKTATEGSDRSGGGRSGSGNEISITMSGLLNAVDGGASQERRVLIMTTNYPEKLDDALIRPGRVDMKVEVSLASKEQIRERFVRMYSVDSREAACMSTNLKQIIPDVLQVGVPAISEKNDDDRKSTLHLPARLLPPAPLRTPTTAAPSRDTSASRASFPLDSAFSLQCEPSPELEKLVDMFTDNLPEAIFSPAELQGYLLMRKKDPRNVVAELAAWRNADLAKRNEKKKQKEEKEKEGKKDEGKGRERE